MQFLCLLKFLQEITQMFLYLQEYMIIFIVLLNYQICILVLTLCSLFPIIQLAITWFKEWVFGIHVLMQLDKIFILHKRLFGKQKAIQLAYQYMFLLIKSMFKQEMDTGQMLKHDFGKQKDMHKDVRMQRIISTCF